MEQSLPHRIREAAEALIAACLDRGVMIATAESCTGGLVAGAITDVPGSSAAFERGWVTYSNQSKCQEVGVDAELIAAHGAVSPEVAAAMATGAAEKAGVAVGLSTTGVAGPGGGSPEKPVGLVQFAARIDGDVMTEEQRFGSLSRENIRMLSVLTALELGRTRLMQIRR